MIRKIQFNWLFVLSSKIFRTWSAGTLNSLFIWSKKRHQALARTNLGLCPFQEKHIKYFLPTFSNLEKLKSQKITLFSPKNIKNFFDKESNDHVTCVPLATRFYSLKYVHSLPYHNMIFQRFLASKYFTNELLELK